MAFSYLQATFGPGCIDLDIPFLKRLDKKETRTLTAQIEKRLNCPLTSSCGRLFDAVSSLIGIRDTVNYEGQAAIEMEMAADATVEDRYCWTMTVSDDGLYIIDTTEIIRGIVNDIEKEAPTSAMAARFHNTVADIIAEVCSIISRQTGLDRVALSGGVFQNIFLLQKTLRELRARKLDPIIHHQVPTNDGGIALGQVMIANAQYEKMGVKTSVPSYTGESHTNRRDNGYR